MNKITMTIWGRQFVLDVIYDCYEGEEITKLQQEAYDEFISNNSIVDTVLDCVKNYCLEDENMKDSDSIQNIFKYVIPKSIFVERDEENKVIVLLCDYRFDNEHGIAIVFENGAFKEIVGQSDL